MPSIGGPRGRNSDASPHTLHTATASVVKTVIEFFVAQRVQENLIGVRRAANVRHLQEDAFGTLVRRLRVGLTRQELGVIQGEHCVIQWDFNLDKRLVWSAAEGLT